MSTAIEIRPPEQQVSVQTGTPYEPQSFEEAVAFADYISKSDLVPSAYRNKPANCFVAMQHGKELGLSPMQAIQGIRNINGSPGVFGDHMLAIVQAHPAYEWHKEWFSGDGDKLEAHCQVKRRGHEAHEETFSVTDAKVAGLWDTRAKITTRDGGEMSNPAPWHCYPKRMLKMRARGFALRDKFADALKGVKSVEELDDYPTTIDQTLPPGGQARQTDSDPGILPEDANAFGQALKKSGRNLADMREYLKTISTPERKVETSLQIPQSKFAAAMEWANTPKTEAKQQAAHTESTEQKPADPNPNSAPAEPIVSEDERKAREGAGFLDWTPKELDRWFLHYERDWSKVAAEAQRQLDKRSADEQ